MSQTSRLDEIAAEAREAGAPAVDPHTGRFLHALVLATGASRVLEIGTGFGASAIWLATALPPGGLMISLERDRGRAERARAHLDAAGLGGTVSVMVGEAMRFLHKVAGPFDVIFDDGGTAEAGGLHEKLAGLLKRGGTLVRRGDAPADDERFFTTQLVAGERITLAVRTR